MISNRNMPTTHPKELKQAIDRYVTPEAAAQELLLRRKARSSLLDYAAYMRPNLDISKHHIFLANILQMALTGQELPGWGHIDRLMVTMPPRHSKSTFASILAPSWYIGNSPEKHIICCSYSDRLATSFGRAVRNIVAHPRFSRLFPDTTLSPDSKAANRWNTSAGGSYIAAGMDGSITGFGMNLGILDDYVKGRKDAKSSSWWEFARDWYKNDFYSRLMPPGVIIIVATRWAEDDLIGWLHDGVRKAFDDLGEDQDRWLLVNLPALAEADDVLGREQGEALWEQWYSADRLRRIKTVMGIYFDALYQGKPSTEDTSGLSRDWFQWYDELPVPVRKVQSWDTGFKAETTSAYSSMISFADCYDGYYITNWFRERMIYPDLKQAVINHYAEERPHVVLIEDKASGTPLCQELLRGTKIPACPVPCNDRSKEERAIAISPTVRAGKVFLPRFKQWAPALLENLVRCKDEKDSRDAFTQAILWMNENSYVPLSYESQVSRRFSLSTRGFL